MASRGVWGPILSAAVTVVVVLLVLWVGVAAAAYSPKYVIRVLSSLESDMGDYLNLFPASPPDPAPEPFIFASNPGEDRVRNAFEQVLQIPDLDTFLADNGTQAFIVIQDDGILYSSTSTATGATRC